MRRSSRVSLAVAALLALAVVTTSWGCATEQLSLAGESVRLTSIRSDVAPCRPRATIEGRNVNAVRNKAAMNGADVIFSDTMVLPNSYQSFDCGGRYIPKVKAVPTGGESSSLTFPPGLT